MTPRPPGAFAPVPPQGTARAEPLPRRVLAGHGRLDLRRPVERSGSAPAGDSGNPAHAAAGDSGNPAVDGLVLPVSVPVQPGALGRHAPFGRRPHAAAPR